MHILGYIQSNQAEWRSSRLFHIGSTFLLFPSPTLRLLSTYICVQQIPGQYKKVFTSQLDQSRRIFSSASLIGEKMAPKALKATAATSYLDVINKCDK